MAHKARAARRNDRRLEPPTDAEKLARKLGLRIVGSIARGGKTEHWRMYNARWLVGEWWSGNGRVRIGAISRAAESLNAALEVVGSFGAVK